MIRRTFLQAVSAGIASISSLGKKPETVATTAGPKRKRICSVRTITCTAGEDLERGHLVTIDELGFAWRSQRKKQVRGVCSSDTPKFSKTIITAEGLVRVKCGLPKEFS